MTERPFLYLESSVGGDQTDEPLDDEAKEESEASNVEIPLSSEAPHVLGNGSLLSSRTAHNIVCTVCI